MAWLNIALWRPQGTDARHAEDRRAVMRPRTPRGHYWIVAGTLLLMLLLSSLALHLDADRMLGQRPDTEMIVND